MYTVFLDRSGGEGLGLGVSNNLNHDGLQITGVSGGLGLAWKDKVKGSAPTPTPQSEKASKARHRIPSEPSKRVVRRVLVGLNKREEEGASHALNSTVS